MAANFARRRLVFGVGFNDANYQVSSSSGTCCPFYTKWRTVLKRCYYDPYKLDHPTYEVCTIDSDWLTFSRFKSWMESQDWQGMQLDKDLLVTGNKHYSPDTCLFVDAQVNLFLTKSEASRGEHPIGVSYDKLTGKYWAQVGELGKGQVKLGRYDSPEVAHKVYWKRKCELARELASKQTNQVVSKRLLEIYKD